MEVHGKNKTGDKMKLEDIDKRLKEIPALLESIKAEQNQLLGYKQALLDIKEENKDKKKN